MTFVFIYFYSDHKGLTVHNKGFNIALNTGYVDYNSKYVCSKTFGITYNYQVTFFHNYFIGKFTFN